MLGRRAFLKQFLGTGTVMLAAACAPAPPQAAPPTAAAPGQGAPAATAAPKPAQAAAPTAAPAQQTGPAPSGATFRSAIPAETDVLDPPGLVSSVANQTASYIYETLVLRQPDGKLAPGLAERWDVTPDGKTITFFLRKGVKFHDGADLDAEAVKLSISRNFNPNMKVTQRAGFEGDVETVSVVDPGTVRLQLRTSYGPILSALSSVPFGIISPNQSKKFPEAYTEEYVGTGPYKFKERRKGESVTFERFDGYWGKKPYYGSQVMRIVPDPATRESLLLANQVEAIMTPPLSDIPALQRNPNVKVVMKDANRSIFLPMDQTLPGGTPLTDKRVRHALNYAVDRDSIVKNLLFGTATVMDAPMAPGIPQYVKTGPYPYDPAKARQLLQEAGTPSLSLKFIHPTGRYPGDAQAAQAISEQFRQIGVETTLQSADFGAFVNLVRVPADKGVSHLHLFGWAPGIPDASQALFPFTKTQWPPAGWGTSHYTNPEVEELLAQAVREPNEQKSQEMYTRIQKIIWDDAPVVFLWTVLFPIAHSAKVKDVIILTTEQFSSMYAEPA